MIVISHEGRLEAPETLWPDMAKGPTYLSVKKGAGSTSGSGQTRTFHVSPILRPYSHSMVPGGFEVMS
jgi:hypothetical protein